MVYVWMGCRLQPECRAQNETSMRMLTRPAVTGRTRVGSAWPSCQQDRRVHKNVLMYSCCQPRIDRWLLKVHCHAIQCFYVDFLRSKMAARRLEAAAHAEELDASIGSREGFLALHTRSFAIDRRRSTCQLPKLILSHIKSTLGFKN